MKIENVEVYGFRRALYGMRNPKESWGRSDSQFLESGTRHRDLEILALENPRIGPDDLKLACSLIVAGKDHRKFLRMIGIWWDITLPRCVWQEKDTYKVATVRNSCSTMHKLGFRDLGLDDFQDEDVDADVLAAQNAMGLCYRNKQPYTDPKNGKSYEGVKLLNHMKYRLPEGFLQKATYSFNYEIALAMYSARHSHRMPEWSGPDGMCHWLLRLPYLRIFIEAHMGEIQCK